MAFKTKKNLIKTPTEYTRYYGDFRGVDFSSEQTEVHDQRFAYAVNMYRDYRNSEGNVLETIPGFRRVIQDAEGGKINGAYKWNEHLFLHIDTKLYAIPDDGVTVGVTKQYSFILKDTYSHTFPEGFVTQSVKNITTYDGVVHVSNYVLSEDKKSITLTNSDGKWNNYLNTSIVVNYIESCFDDLAWLDGECNDSISSFVEFYNALYMLDGEVIRRITLNSDGTFTKKTLSAYLDGYDTLTPTIYLDISTNDAVNISKFEYEQQNMLYGYYKHTYIGRSAEDNIAKYPLYSEDDIYLVMVTRNDTGRQIQILSGSTDEEWKYEAKDDTISINVGSWNYMEYTVSITYFCGNKKQEENLNKIQHCTIATVFDGRLFVTGNPEYPTTIWYCGYNNEAGIPDVTRWGNLDYIQDGYNGKISCLMPVSDTLAVLKSDAMQEASMYFHTRHETGKDYIPVTYPRTSGLGGLGKIYTCTNFRDDPIFVSNLGVEAVSQLSVRLERALEHRSYLIDAKLLPLDLSKVKLAEWEGYLVVLAPDGKVFLADSRQRYTHSTGVMQYEWYYLEGIGVYEDSAPEYYYSAIKSAGMPNEISVRGVNYPLDIATNVYSLTRKTSSNLTYSPVKARMYEGAVPKVEDVAVDGKRIYFTIEDTWDGQTYTPDGLLPLTVKKALICEDGGGKVGTGTFYPATSVFNFDGNLYFGTDNGVVCMFNFDMKTKDGKMPKAAYNFDGRTIFCGVATKLDNCGIPHLTKSTIKKSMVLKTKAMYGSVTKIKVRTNAKGYESVARVNSGLFDENDMDFSDFSFAIEDNPILAIKEKEKHWVEKQHWIYSDEFEKPFSIHYLAFRYKVSGRIK